MEDVLSQQEINTLLNAVKTGQFDEEGEAKPAKQIAPPPQVSPYDLTKSHRIIRGRMPTYDVMNERLARLLRSSLFNMIRKPVEVEHSQTQLVKFQDFISSLEEPSCLNLVRFPPLRNISILALETDLLTGFVEHLFGGSGTNYSAEGKEFSSIELSLVRKLATIVLSDLRKVWEPIYPVEPEFIRTEVNPHLASIAAPSDVVIKTTFTVDLEASTRSSMSIVIPYSVIEPIKSLLSSAIQADHGEAGGVWASTLRDVAEDVSVDIRAILGVGGMTVRELMSLEIGHTIQLDTDSDHPLTCQVQGVDKAWGRAVNVHGRIGVRLDASVGEEPPIGTNNQPEHQAFRFRGENDE